MSLSIGERKAQTIEGGGGFFGWIGESKDNRAQASTGLAALYHVVAQHPYGNRYIFKTEFGRGGGRPDVLQSLPKIGYINSRGVRGRGQYSSVMVCIFG